MTDRNLHSSYCRDKNRGGTAILVRKNIDVKPIKIVSELAADFYFECCGIEIAGIDLIIIVIYRIPQQTSSHVGVFIHKIDNLLEKINSTYKKNKVILCGDWNIDTLKDTNFSRNLTSTLLYHNFTMHIKVPSRQNACIDQMASNIKIVEAHVHYLYLSDHETAQTLLTDVKKTKVYTSWFEYKRDYCNVNIRKFHSCIAALSFSEVIGEVSTETAFRNFYDLLCLFYKLCFPIIKVKINNRQNQAKWLTLGIRNSC